MSTKQEIYDLSVCIPKSLAIAILTGKATSATLRLLLLASLEQYAASHEAKVSLFEIVQATELHP